ncbi:hypothetical protein CO180_00650 [candidate division WWE3 bacterium CG_4_9_14_3_um_filter_41_6]|uniref:YwbE family protein n=1 Tax=candidate division WWE3 bacterium CG_4_10_14_0_2_um_filter_41_14 TaxID=1975072 RepID=A0A2M7TGT5_UNCKA|nr:MAG: hypothetical protein COY32_05360 [candidate division WWE3 bacterium CG_4_10_14_0_2_um_filter_41_14]PJA39478.1 MAG: hypothetical protein CO180_00650 [candidate division WWE3 bacterium CG_4_9_14_3_um_filter_41_6]
MHEKPNHDPATQKYPQKGDHVRVAQKANYENGVLTEGIVQDVLTSKRFHPRGHKVRLTNGKIGRIQQFVDQTTPDHFPLIEADDLR